METSERLVRRSTQERVDDCLMAGERAIAVCSFWLSSRSYAPGANTSPRGDSHRWASEPATLAVGEELSPATFPHAFTHLGLIQAAADHSQPARLTRCMRAIAACALAWDSVEHSDRRWMAIQPRIAASRCRPLPLTTG